MKKTAANKVIILLFTTVFLFSSCKAEELNRRDVTADLSKNFTATADVVISDIQFTAQIQKNGEGTFTATITAPESLRGTEFIVDDNMLTASYNGLELCINSNTMPTSAMLLVIKNVFDKAGSIVCPQGLDTEESLLLEGECSSGSYTIHLDKATGSVLRIEILEENIVIEFTEFAFT